MELLDVLDEQGNFTSKTKPRTDVHRDGDWHRTVHVWLLNSKQELLIQKRGPTKDLDPNCWMVSVAGHISAGATKEDTAIKEVFEEIGITLKKDQLEYLFTSPRTFINDTYVFNELHDIFLVQVDILLEALKLEADEVVGVRWVQYRALEKEIQENPSNFSPNFDEYERLFKLLQTREQ